MFNAIDEVKRQYTYAVQPVKLFEANHSQAAQKFVLDFDFVDYTTITRDGDVVEIEILVREVYYTGGKVKCRQVSKKIRLKRAKIEHRLENVGGVALRCRNCGTSMDAFAQECPSCGTRHNYLQEWYMI